MIGFIDYFLDRKRKPRSVKRSFLGNLCRNMSCSGSRERKSKRVMTPISKTSAINFNNLKDSQSEQSFNKRSKPAKTAARRKINLNCKPVESRSDKIITTVSRGRKSRRKPARQPLEVSTHNS